MAFKHNKDDDIVAGDGPSDHDNYDSTRLNDTAEETVDPDSGVKRGLKNRHLSMMALAGIIGPGLLVGAGGALNVGGPAALLIGFGVVGMLSTLQYGICEEDVARIQALSNYP
jgi:amino acid transporter